MKALVFLLACLLAASPCLALSDAEYKELKESSSGFRDADRELGSIWKRIMKIAKGEKRRSLLEEQRYWINEERDEWANEFIEVGLGRAFAYERATIRRVHELEVEEYNLHLSPRDLERGRGKSYLSNDRAEDHPEYYKK